MSQEDEVGRKLKALSDDLDSLIKYIEELPSHMSESDLLLCLLEAFLLQNYTFNLSLLMAYIKGDIQNAPNTSNER